MSDGSQNQNQQNEKVALFSVKEKRDKNNKIFMVGRLGMSDVIMFQNKNQPDPNTIEWTVYVKNKPPKTDENSGRGFSS